MTGKRLSEMRRIDSAYAAYLSKRAKKEGVTVVELTRRIIAAIVQKKARTQ